MGPGEEEGVRPGEGGYGAGGEAGEEEAGGKGGGEREEAGRGAMGEEKGAGKGMGAGKGGWEGRAREGWDLGEGREDRAMEGGGRAALGRAGWERGAGAGRCRQRGGSACGRQRAPGRGRECRPSSRHGYVPRLAQFPARKYSVLLRSGWCRDGVCDGHKGG